MPYYYSILTKSIMEVCIMKKRFIILCMIIAGLVLLFSSANAKSVKYYTYTVLNDGTAKIIEGIHHQES